MISVIINNETVAIVKNWDSALRVCAKEFMRGADYNTMRIIDSKGEELPVTIKHLII